ncbi:MAG: beta-propeller fold lactonase family protein [Silvibacterium sp.]
MRRAIESMSMLFVMATLLLPIHAKANNDFNDSGHAVFIMSNSVDRNEVIAFAQAADGTLHESGRFPTGGRGSGGNNDPLESQGSLTLSQDHPLLFALNAGSGQISVFDVHGSHLELSDKVQSEGSEPNAIAQHGNLVYVLNAGGSSNVAGFVLEGDHLHYIKNSLAFLSTNTSGAASIAFSPDGKFLAVTERLTNDIDVFKVQNDGTLSPIVINPSAGPGAFSVSFAPNGVALVSETGPANVSNGSAISSYAILANGTLSAISTSVPTLGGANCWNVVTPDGRFVYVSNAGSSTISGFAISSTGALSALPGTVVGENPAGATNLDLAVSADGKFLFTLNSMDGTIGTFAIQKDGTLKNLGPANGFSSNSGYNGIAAN